jgi:hypothetical protein
VGPTPLKRTSKPKIAGILNMIAGVVFGAAAFGGCMNVINAGRTDDAWMVALLIPGTLSLIGGIYALSREKWPLAFAGSILAIPIGLGILSTICITLSRNEFK